MSALTDFGVMLQMQTSLPSRTVTLEETGARKDQGTWSSDQSVPGDQYDSMSGPK